MSQSRASLESVILTNATEFSRRLLMKCAESDGGCMIWVGMQNGKRQPYGRIQIGRYFVRAHRASWIVRFGPIPSGLHVLHRCDNTLCINPAHLFLGSHAENMADRTLKGRNKPLSGDAWQEAHAGRSPSGARHYMHKHPERIRRGEDCASAKLTHAAVSSIRKEWAAATSKYGVASMLAGKYGIDRTYVWMIVTNKVWRDA